MKLLEYEAKGLLRQYSLPLPDSQLIRSANDSLELSLPVVLKVQIPKGGRGKAGGVRVVNDRIEYGRITTELLEKPILGFQATSLLAEEKMDCARELYLSIVIDRSSGLLTLLASKQGGIEVEQLATSTNPLLSIRLNQSPNLETATKVYGYFELSDTPLQKLQELLERLYEVCVKEDALLVEINPLMVLVDGSLICADAKIELDDDAAFRHVERNAGFEDTVTSSQFVELNADGSVASMANGAGLAMATVDAIKAAGAEPANFYDVGGGTNVEGMVKAFQKIANMPKVTAIVVNIFGGITRCDEVAEAIIGAKKVCNTLPDLFIRLTGTNEAEGKHILEAADISFYPTLAACVEEAVKSQKVKTAKKEQIS